MFRVVAREEEARRAHVQQHQTSKPMSREQHERIYEWVHNTTVQPAFEHAGEKVTSADAHRYEKQVILETNRL